MRNERTTPALCLGISLAAAVLTITVPTPATSRPVSAPAQERGGESLVHFTAAARDFPLATDGHPVPIVQSPADAPAVRHAASDLADDIALVTGARPELLQQAPAGAPAIVLIGTLGHSPAIDRLVATRRLDARRLTGAWESFLIATVAQPMPGVDKALVIVGSDRRGTAYGAYELSRAIGVSPWVWWADVAPARHPTLAVAAGTRRFGPPSVRYRGLFLNDEDWGLFPWASRTYDPARGNFGPKTYARIFQLLMRLRANTLWPAMHKVSAPFNSDPENARLADEYGIVMGSSHAEPMLRDNVGEWRDAPDRFDYAANRDGVRAYWEARVVANAKYESLWPLGMRGIHDSGMLGAATDADKAALLDHVIADQRGLLAKHVDADPTKAPQVFTPYKEVLPIYDRGLKLPDDVTIIWPDDNFGYIRRFPDAAERARKGGSGVYYHLSYLGAPLAYLWLGTTPPALIGEEMGRAWDTGARQVWIANAGDIKPSEIGIDYFLSLAWDVEGTRRLTQRQWLDGWAARTFGGGQAQAIGAILDGYYRLNFERRPEHLQWWLPGEKPRFSALSGAEIDARLARFATLEAAVATVTPRIPSALADAWFELVDYPVRASSAANTRAFAAERYARLIDQRPAEARQAAGIALAADRTIKSLTARFNDDIAGGKWRHILAEEPADNQWRSMRMSPVILPTAGLASPGAQLPAIGDKLPTILEAESAAPAPGWHLAKGLGRGEGAMIADQPGARLDLMLEVPTGAPQALELDLLPLFPEDRSGALALDLAIDGAPPQHLSIPRAVETRDWSLGVLDNLLAVPTSITLSPGRHRIAVTARSTGLALDRLRLAAPQESPAR